MRIAIDLLILTVTRELTVLEFDFPVGFLSQCNNYYFWLKCVVSLDICLAEIESVQAKAEGFFFGLGPGTHPL